MKQVFTNIPRQLVVGQQWNSNSQKIEDTVRVYDVATYIVCIKQLVEIRKAIQNNRVKVIPEGSRVYFSKSSTFSRLKFRGWASRYKCSITRSIEKANIIVTDVKAYNEVLRNLNDTQFHMGGAGGQYGLFIYYRSFQYNFTGTKTYPGNLVRHKTIGSSIRLSERESVEEMTKFPYVSGKFISSKDLADLIFTHTMGEDEYTTISDMFKSGNSADIELAVELMSNFNWIGSAYYLTKLFYGCNKEIAYSKNYKSVTFAHLKNLFDEYCDIHHRSASEFKALFGYLVMKGRESVVTDEYVINPLKKEIQRDVDRLCETLGDLTNIKLLDLNVQIDTPNSDKTFRITF